MHEGPHDRRRWAANLLRLPSGMTTTPKTRFRFAVRHSASRLGGNAGKEWARGRPVHNVPTPEPRIPETGAGKPVRGPLKGECCTGLINAVLRQRQAPLAEVRADRRSPLSRSSRPSVHRLVAWGSQRGESVTDGAEAVAAEAAVVALVFCGSVFMMTCLRVSVRV